MGLTPAQMLLVELFGATALDGRAPQGKAPHAYRGTPARPQMSKGARSFKRRLALRLFKGHRP
jgi:hypothetical protein